MDSTDFVGAFERLTRVYGQARDLALKAAKLSPVQLSVLSEAARKPGTSVPILASALSMTTAAAGKAVDALVKRGLLQKDETGVEPTAKGAEVWTAIAQAIGGATSIATAISGFINTVSGAVGKWSDRAFPAPKKKGRRT